MKRRANTCEGSKLYFGLKDGRSRTLEEVGKDLGVSRERVR